MRRLASLLLACSAAAAAGAPAPVAQKASAPPAPRFEDSMAQRTLACTSCHGKEGRAGPDGYYPRIAGKPEGYLYNQLLNFRDGRRHYGLMARLLAPLSDDYLLEIARHFARQDVPYPKPPPTTAPSDVLLRGRQLAHQGDKERRLPACASCHGATLTGVAPNVPGLLGLPRDYLNAQLGAWRTGQRRAHAPDCMADIARRLAPDDVQAVTAWLAAEPVAPVKTPAPARRKPVRKAAPAADDPPAPRCGSAYVVPVPR